jgi:deoxyribonuclease V
MEWPRTREALFAEQRRLAALSPPPWLPPAGPLTVAGVFVAFAPAPAGSGESAEQAWAAAAIVEDGRLLEAAAAPGEAGAPYEVGALALRVGPLLERAIRALAGRADVVLVNGTGRDHPRGAGVALHLGAVLDLPTVGVTHRPLVATGEWPAGPERGRHSPLLLDGAVVGAWLRAVEGRRPIAVHAAWRTDPAVAVELVQAATTDHRTPLPLRLARQAAREARAEALGLAPARQRPR